MPSAPQIKAPVILMVDDDPADVRLTREALKTQRLSVEMYAVADGIEAMAFLHRKQGYAQKPRPDLILLDLNMPRMNGRETLQAIKTDPVLKNIPVIILTTSERKEDILMAYDHNANCYITKPAAWRDFVKTIDLIEDFWLNLVQLPKG